MALRRLLLLLHTWCSRWSEPDAPLDVSSADCRLSKRVEQSLRSRSSVSLQPSEPRVRTIRNSIFSMCFRCCINKYFVYNRRCGLRICRWGTFSSSPARGLGIYAIEYTYDLVLFYEVVVFIAHSWNWIFAEKAKRLNNVFRQHLFQSSHGKSMLVRKTAFERYKITYVRLRVTAKYNGRQPMGKSHTLTANSTEFLHTIR